MAATNKTAPAKSAAPATSNVVALPGTDMAVVADIFAKVRAKGEIKTLRATLADKIKGKLSVETVDAFIAPFLKERAVASTARTLRLFLILGGKEMGAIDTHSKELYAKGEHKGLWTSHADAIAKARLVNPAKISIADAEAALAGKGQVGKAAIAKGKQVSAMDAIDKVIAERSDLSKPQLAKAKDLAKALRAILG
jgi:hypothetical protein